MIFLLPFGGAVLLHDNVIELIRDHARQDEAESGGILIGSYRLPHLEVMACTEPLPGDHRGRCFFDRKDPGHQRIALRHWRESGGTVTCVGEWHTHPEDQPHPSSQDLVNWRKQLVKMPKLFLIAGRAGLWCASAAVSGPAPSAILRCAVI